jgi:hypothetical protein
VGLILVALLAVLLGVGLATTGWQGWRLAVGIVVALVVCTCAAVVVSVILLVGGGLP